MSKSCQTFPRIFGFGRAQEQKHNLYKHECYGDWASNYIPQHTEILNYLSMPYIEKWEKYIEFEMKNRTTVSSRGNSHNLCKSEYWKRISYTNSLPVSWQPVHIKISQASLSNLPGPQGIITISSDTSVSQTLTNSPLRWEWQIGGIIIHWHGPVFCLWLAVSSDYA